MTDEEREAKAIKCCVELKDPLEKGEMTLTEAERWVVLKERVNACEKCPLHEGSNKVFGLGYPKAPFLFVGEAPREEDNFREEPFRGKVGKLLKGTMHKVGFKRGDVYMTNCCRCRPPENRTPTRTEVGTCFMHLWEQLELIQPKMIIAIGSVALKELCPQNKRAIGGARGSFNSGYGYKVMPVWHPSYVLGSHSELRLRELEKDLTKAYLEIFAVEG